MASFKVFPNPASDLITVTAIPDHNQTIRISIADLSGKQVYQEELNYNSGLLEKQIDLSTYRKGVYLVQLNLNGKVQTEKLIIQ